MSTLIAVYTSDGCVGRCDAKCYGASEPKCDCICTGRNHGAGIEQASNNTREYAAVWVEAMNNQRKAQGREPVDIQPLLF